MYSDILINDLPADGNAGLETFDPRLADVSGLVLKLQYAEACDAIIDLFNEGVNDIRMVGYLLYGDFVNQGVLVLEPMIAALRKSLGDNWSSFGPQKNKEKHTHDAITWLLTYALQVLDSAKEASDDRWRGWLSDAQPDAIERTRNDMVELWGQIEERVADKVGDLRNLYIKFSKWVDAFHELIEVEEVAEPEPEADAPVESVQADGPPAPVAADALTIKRSHHLELLMAKMAAFTELAQREEYARAAIVSLDIQQTLSAFDPTIFFPELFADYKRQMAICIGDLMNYVGDQDSPAWTALSEYYQVDLNGFLKL
ncbi:MAG: type VI secretion system protein IglI family protein [Myxococcota bacterium]|nr:type VI secretion system protein IglI family protein [Myxococcota bacterium]